MANKVGTKGQVVIDKEIRDKLGIGPGWLALQRIVDGHLEINFVMPEHNRSLKGVLAPYINSNAIETDEDWHKAKEMAWEAAVREKMGSGESES